MRSVRDRKTGVAPRAAAAALLLLVACKFQNTATGSGTVQPLVPTATAAGTPVGAPVEATLEARGGTLTAAGGRLVLSAPSSLGRTTRFTVTPISNRAHGGVGEAFRIVAQPPIAGPVTLTFKGLDQYGAGTGIEELGVVFQEGGFWRSAGTVVRDARANTVTVTTTHLSDWALVWQNGTPALAGTFTLTQRVRTPFSATGTATLFRRDPTGTAAEYVLTGTVALPAQILVGGAQCTPDAPVKTIAPTTAEVRNAQFRWGLNARWGLACTGADGAPFSDEIATLFDTLRISLPRCGGAYTGTQVNGAELIQGGFTIDCGAEGTVSAAWNFQTCTAGAICEPGPQCRTGTVACNGGFATCVDSGNAPDGAPCTGGVCSAGACVPCAAGTACTPENACNEGVLTCSAGPVCEDLLVPRAPGTSCGIDAVCANGVCNPCRVGDSCTSATPCRTAALTCNTGVPVCTDTGIALDGTSCGANQVCSAGDCVACTPGTPCTPQNACHEGVISCEAGPVCNDTGRVRPDGASCGENAVCGAGVCNACQRGTSCPSGDPCRTAVLTCDTGFAVCSLAGNSPDGTTCGTNSVCQAGACVPCTQGASCTPTNPCHAGTQSCAAGPTCVDAGTLLADGTSCGQDLVCRNGACVGCAAGQACTSPTNPCRVGTTSCATGTQVCDASQNAPNGTSCGSGLVCSEGACVACAAGAACTPGNPCHLGTLSCTAGPVCTDTGAVRAAGTSCGTGSVCSPAGTCVTCPAGEACTTGNPCTTGTVACTTGVQVCATTPVADGTSCGTGQVCNEGSCVACNGGAPCTSPTNPCRVGTISCATGEPVCNLSADAPNGTTCGAGLVCNTGACIACSAGGACTAPDNACQVGTLSCATGTSVCNVTGPAPNGTVCGAGRVCSGGTCVACAAGTACTSPTNPCDVGTISCATGAPVCQVSGPAANGTPCGEGQVCNGGACVACPAGTTCDPTAACETGTISCATGAPVCQATGNEPNGTTCGVDQVCFGGVCAPCAAGQACASTTGPCKTAAIACGTGIPVCTDTGNQPNGSPCGGGLFCGGGVCGACSAAQGLPCTPAATPCSQGEVTCSLEGVASCTAIPAPQPDATPCGAGLICVAGACGACVEGQACTPPAAPCKVGQLLCATATTPTSCAATAADVPDGTPCGTAGQVCAAGACVAGP